VNEEVLNPAQHPAQHPAPEPEAPRERAPLVSRASVFLAETVDGFSFAFFCLSFSSLTHLLSSWWFRFSAEE
jgi:hypothetical protein